MNHYAAYLKLIKYCKSTILQFLKGQGVKGLLSKKQKGKMQDGKKTI